MDTKTIFVYSFFLTAVVTAAMALVYRTRKTYPGFGWWLAGAASWCLGAAFFLLPRDRFPPWLTIVLSNYLFLVDLLLFVRGTRRFKEQPAHSWSWDIAASLLFCGLFLFFTYVVPSTAYRIIVLSVFSVGMAAAMLRVLLRGRNPRIGAAERSQTWIWAFLVALNGVRAVYTWMYEKMDIDFMHEPTMQFVMMMMLLLAAQAVPLTQILMNEKRAQDEAREEMERRLAEMTRDETKTQESLKVKETLLRELYHRTKNNMMTIIAMMSIHAAEKPDAPLDAFVDDIKQKIMSMALVHQKLCQESDLSRINLHEYLEELARLSLENAEMDKRIALRMDLYDVPVFIDTAIPIGLVVNELLSNTMKHAFPDGRTGEVRIRLTKENDGSIELRLSDNGVGVPPAFNLETNPSYGLRTVFAIVSEQIGGTITMESAYGTGYTIRFKDADPARKA